jgi:hypothetical protein
MQLFLNKMCAKYVLPEKDSLLLLNIAKRFNNGENGAKIVDHFFVLGSATPCASPPPRPAIFSNCSFWIHHLVNRNDHHLLAHAMASDFSVTWQFLSKRIIGFSLRIKLHPQKF